MVILNVSRFVRVKKSFYCQSTGLICKWVVLKKEKIDVINYYFIIIHHTKCNNSARNKAVRSTLFAAFAYIVTLLRVCFIFHMPLESYVMCYAIMDQVSVSCNFGIELPAKLVITSNATDSQVIHNNITKKHMALHATHSNT